MPKDQTFRLILDLSKDDWALIQMALKKLQMATTNTARQCRLHILGNNIKTRLTFHLDKEAVNEITNEGSFCKLYKKGKPSMLADCKGIGHYLCKSCNQYK